MNRRERRARERIARRGVGGVPSRVGRIERHPYSLWWDRGYAEADAEAVGEMLVADGWAQSFCLIQTADRGWGVVYEAEVPFQGHGPMPMAEFIRYSQAV